MPADRIGLGHAPSMLVLIVILVVLWLLGVTLTHIGGLLYLLLVLAAILIIYNFLKGRRRL